jgi:hypothetical protein
MQIVSNKIHFLPSYMKMDNPEKLASLGTKDEDKQSKIHRTICDGHHYPQINTYNMNKI